MSRKRRVLVTGFGIVSPLGRNAAENRSGLERALDAVSPVSRFDVSRTRCKNAGQIPPDWLEDAQFSGRKGNSLHPSSRMMTLALRECLGMAGSASPELMVVATSSGAMSNGEAFYRRTLAQEPRGAAAALVANYMPQKPVQDAQKANGLRLPTEIISNACSSGSNAVGHGFELVRRGIHGCVVCGGYDPLAELVYVGFDSLQAATPDRIRPFDRGRTGLVLGEGAAMLMLESEESVVARGADACAEVLGYGISTDTYHLTQPHPSGIGPRLAMERALRSGEVIASEVDYINAHGTGTQFNDATEGIAISELFGQVPVSSTKSMMGHALGGAGAIEAGFCVLALQHQFLPPNINFREAEPGWAFTVVANAARPGRLRKVLSNSFGFGGANASLLFGQI